MNVSQKTFIGWSLALLPIIMTGLYMFVFIGAGEGDANSQLKNVAENALLNKLLISIAFVSFSLVIISLVMYSREISSDSDNPFLGNFTAVVFLLTGVINLSGGNYFSAAISMYDTVPGDAILAFVIGSVEFGANDILFGIGFITLGRAIRDVNNKNLNQISLELKEISDKCRKLKIDKKEFFGGSMTITSLGGIGGSFFTPIINYPEVAILGVGRTYYKQVFIDEEFHKRIMLPLSLSYDHRIIDGAEAARFSNELKENLGKNFAYKLAI